MADETHAPRRVERIRHELRRRAVEVARVETISPNLVAVTFAGAELDGFVSLGFDDHVKLTLDDLQGEPARRDYTPRRFDADARTLTIEFALHGEGEGIAATWAAAAKPGDRAIVGGPKGSLVIPTDYPWHLLAGDLTALPAIARRLEELPQGTRASVIVQANAVDRRPLPIGAGMDLRWLDPDQPIADCLRTIAIDPDGFVWAAGEAADMAAAREILLHERGHPLEAMRVSAYWKHAAGEVPLAEGEGTSA